jgi:hypothetical protein
VLDTNPPGSGEGLSPVAAMSLGLRRFPGWIVCLLSGGTRLSLTFRRVCSLQGLGAQDVADLLGARAEKELPESGDGGVLVANQIRHVDQRLQRLVELGALLLGQRTGLRPLQNVLKLLHAYFQPLNRPLHLTPPSSWRKSFRSGYPRISFRERLASLVGASLPRPVVRPRHLQLAAR